MERPLDDAPLRQRSSARALKAAFFSMEVGIDDAIPVFSGGLGVLAGDFLSSAADIGLSVVGVTLLYRSGYFLQHLDPSGRQTEDPVRWSPDRVLELLPQQTSIDLDGTSVAVRVWRKVIEGRSGDVTLLLLDTDVPENDAAHRDVTDQLYSGNQGHRLRQEAVLGMGGIKALRSLGFDPTVIHMNEGHCSLLTLELLEEKIGASSSPSESDIEAVRGRCVFTTHTPVAAGHDRFESKTVRSVLGERRLGLLEQIGCLEDGSLNMTTLGLRLSAYANGVSIRHGEVSREMFPETPIRSITNGVRAASWVAPGMQALFDRHIPGWRDDNQLLRYATGIALEELQEAHRSAKASLVDRVRSTNGVSLDLEALTIGLARRATPYKRTTLLFSDLDRLRAIAAKFGPVQVICSGKAHPQDLEGKQLISDIASAARALSGTVEVVFVEGYNLGLAKLLCSGSDVWLNTPLKPYEASGTSGMKAALNGVPSLSVLDGWWVEGCFEGITGWAVGDHSDESDDAENLYEKLGGVVAQLFYGDPQGFLEVRRASIALNGSFFNTERMVREYELNAYRPLVSGAAP